MYWAHDRKTSMMVLGGGSNVLISDAGYDGLVLHLDLRGINVESEDDDAVIVNVAAGESWDDFVALAVKNGWAGIECLSGIPGRTGATPIQNVGAYGQDVSETIVRVEALDTHEGRTRWFTNEECAFAYRWSFFKSGPGRFIVVSVTFRLRKNAPATVRYPELKGYLADRGASLDDLPTVREAVIAIRKRKGMVLDPGDPDTRSDGSFFMNPILTADDFARFCTREGTSNAPNFPAGAGKVKLSAAWLIEQAGFHKGFIHGNAGLSSKHTLAVINRGGATAEEIAALVRMIRGTVQEKFGVELHPEPVFVGVSLNDER